MKRAVVTRPAVEAERWVSALEREGWQAQALPLIEIAPVPDPLPLRRVRERLCEFDALMFVSASAVEHFCAGQPWPAAPDALPRCYADVMATDRERFNRYFHAMLDRGVYFAPALYEAGFVSSAHSADDIAATVAASRAALG